MMANMSRGKEPEPGKFALAFAAEVRALIGRKNVSGADLARLTGRSQSYVSKRLRGEAAFTANDAEAISAALRVDLEALLVAAVRASRRH
jgi:transcriptional regulator with XRE-family HTH domain